LRQACQIYLSHFETTTSRCTITARLRPIGGRERYLKTSNLRAVLTDSHFWVPAFVLAVGIVLLVLLH
jgi:hypothetical protein